MKKYLLCVAVAALLSLALSGCSSKAEEPAVPANSTPLADSSNSTYTLTDESKLKGLAVGESAVWRDYEITVKSIDRADGALTVNIEARGHGKATTLSTDCLMSFGMFPTATSFVDNTIEVPADDAVTGTFTFDDRYNSQRLFWNDGATEAFWLLDIASTQPAPTPTPEPEKKAEPTENKDNAQKTAIAALEAEIPSLITNNTPLYQFQSVDSATATVTPQEGGGYEYINNISILDGNGNPVMANVRLVCEPNGNCISMTIDGAFLF